MSEFGPTIRSSVVLAHDGRGALGRDRGRSPTTTANFGCGEDPGMETCRRLIEMPAAPSAVVDSPDGFAHTRLGCGAKRGHR